ncbi:ABC transporter substrate-binding protein [Trinickia caryophylli]|uniref:Probable sugar-binding periplasmic protein n=1 Tax=Trinickia caryophylli TaxID=28094 RepID=A0A1X7CJX8_TRICW|nr:ABC transporter substrate-binding protein [Trinickia caryophylli]PMS09109.1 carbohydrate ABC transporter substrate-binding protein [Trinickia caryophylli]TRX19985.1 carbohydrate ABC transporter substrate-binding protein [Trinickia caryophylli]WQE12675.1 ABC transporter substrate-binding protein [Trinickia caryophylli]SME97997.1 carbohydrate ABC transporter substrate-binding protein, CUT1 family [Trinickia caryophylli]GLU30379.1 maltose ABC transporter substrate-binding protein [Trinickia ca
MKVRAIMAALAATGLMYGMSAQAAESVEVLHWWTSGGESKAVGVLKDDMTKQGYTWKDFAVAGGAGAAAMTALKTQVISGNAPSAAQIKGPLIREWADQDVLVNIDSVAKQEDWKKNLPPEIDKIMQAGGHYVAAPFSVHRVNWLYINKAALDKAGGKVPTNWDEFFAVADKMKAAGIQPIAMGGQPWQDLTLWEDVVLSQGAAFYKKALVDLDQSTLTSPQMVKVFDTVRKIQGYFDKGRTGRDWNLATAMVINNKAGMQFMGDWAKGEFANANKKSGVDYICAAVPGTEKAYTFNVDSFVFFQQKGQNGATPGQVAMAKTIMSPAFQEQFSLYKGSIPVRLGVSMAKFDDCAKKSYADEQTAIKSGGYVPSLAHGMAQPDATAGAITDVVTKFMNSSQSSQDAVKALAQAAKTK